MYGNYLGLKRLLGEVVGSFILLTTLQLMVMELHFVVLHCRIKLLAEMPNKMKVDEFVFT